MKKYIIVCLMVALSACNNKKPAKSPGFKEILYYGTKEFEAHEKNTKINKEQAWELQIEYFKPDSLSYLCRLYFIVDGNYVFPQYVRRKLNEARLTGVWVNTKTGVVRYVKNNSIVNLNSDGWYGKFPNIDEE
ncbi:hypothetical protein DMA11_02135 [Marinilabiliaceae bacterium JC017]|nr:hypothetical protein DMA11_02135 [Marinilabiliaceae bacterium JC017]